MKYFKIVFTSEEAIIELPDFYKTKEEAEQAMIAIREDVRMQLSDDEMSEMEVVEVEIGLQTSNGQPIVNYTWPNFWL